MLLARGAAKVHAVDVGHGQLAWKLRIDPRVVVHERLNARYLTRGTLADPVDALVCDASFIGLATLLPAPLALCAPGAWASRSSSRNSRRADGGRQQGRRARSRGAPAGLRARAGLVVVLAAGPCSASTESPILGPEGNREFLIAAIHA